MSEENRGVWIFSEVPEIAFQLLGKGTLLARDLHTELVAVSIGDDDAVEDYIKYGASKVLAVKNPALSKFHVDTYTDALSELVTTHNPEVILIGATRNGLELAPRLAERLKVGCVTSASRIELDSDKKVLLLDRLTFGGNIVETQISRAKPQIATVSKGIFSPLPPDQSRQGQVVNSEVKVNAPSTRLLESKPKHFVGAKLTEAQVIVSFGRGVREKKDVVLVEKFSNTIGGVIGCSRPISEDLEWLPEDKYIGLLGQIVRPKLYFACGISGRVEHISGIRNSKIIVSINNDPKAPIFQSSDYGIVADLYQILPVLTATVNEMKKS